ncbi:CBS domain-containing protein [Nocardioides pacificus]
MTLLTRQEPAVSEHHEPTVSDVLVHHPQTLPANARVCDVRAAFADDHVHMLLLAADDRLVGALVRDDYDASVSDDDPALPLSTLVDRTIAPDVPAEQARQWLVARGRRRLAVVDDDGHLLGLLCLKRRLTGFCSDADVAARAAEAAARHTT